MPMLPLVSTEKYSPATVFPMPKKPLVPEVRTLRPKAVDVVPRETAPFNTLNAGVSIDNVELLVPAIESAPPIEVFEPTINVSLNTADSEYKYSPLIRLASKSPNSAAGALTEAISKISISSFWTCDPTYKYDPLNVSAPTDAPTENSVILVGLVISVMSKISTSLFPVPIYAVLLTISISLTEPPRVVLATKDILAGSVMSRICSSLSVITPTKRWLSLIAGTVWVCAAA